MAEKLQQKAVAVLLGLTSRQVRNLVDAGMPRSVEGGRPVYPWPECARWYIEHKIRLASQGSDDEEQYRRQLTRRKLEAEVRRAELDLAVEEARLVTLDYMEQQLTACLERVRARLQNIAGKWAPAMVGLRSIAEAQSRLEPAVSEVMLSLTETGEDPELDDADADGDGDGDREDEDAAA